MLNVNAKPNEIRLLNVSSCTVKSSANRLIDYDDSFMSLIIRLCGFFLKQYG